MLHQAIPSACVKTPQLLSLLIRAITVTSGWITLPGTAPGNYTFQLTSDDGSQLYLDNALVVNNNGALPHALALRCCHVSDRILGERDHPDTRSMAH